MKLTLLDRIMLLNILPVEGNIKTLIIVKDLTKKIEITRDELNKYEIDSSEEGKLKWNSEGVLAGFEIEFTQLETNEIVKVLKKLDKENKLSINLMPLIDLFNVIGE